MKNNLINNLPEINTVELFTLYYNYYVENFDYKILESTKLKYSNNYLLLPLIYLKDTKNSSEAISIFREKCILDIPNSKKLNIGRSSKYDIKTFIKKGCRIRILKS